MKNLKEEKRWVNYVLGNPDPITGKLPKTPMCPFSNRAASSVEPNDWGTYKQAKQAMDAGLYDGIGIIATPDKMTVLLDIDPKVYKDAKLENLLTAQIKEIIEKSNTHTEISPSGKGLHLYFRTDEPIDLEVNKKSGFEIYSDKRFFTYTENYYGEPKPIRNITKQEMFDIIYLTGYPWKSTDNPQVIHIAGESVFNDHDILERMFASKIGKEIQDLYNGVSDKYNNDKSSEDFAFLSHLSFWSNRDANQMKRIWLSSPLGQREKTQDRLDYQNRTIDAVIRITKETYRIPKQSEYRKPWTKDFLPKPPTTTNFEIND